MSFIKEQDHLEIDLLQILKSIWEHKLFLVALAVVVSMLFAVKTEFFTEDVYVADGTLFISNKQYSESDEAVNQNNINTSVKMSATYREILKTRDFLQGVSQDINGVYKWKSIRSMMSVSAVSNTELLKISVAAHSPEDAYVVAESIVRNAPDKLASVYKNGVIEIIESVVVPAAPVGKGTLSQAMLGAMIGFALGCAIIVIMHLFDKKIHKSEDIVNRYGVSILGEIAQ